MGMDISGGMLVGTGGSDLCEPEDYDGTFYEWAEENGLTVMAEFFDAGQDDSYFGFPVPDIGVDELGIDWVMEVKQLGKKFEELTGVKAELIGVQHVW